MDSWIGIDHAAFFTSEKASEKNTAELAWWDFKPHASKPAVLTRFAKRMDLAKSSSRDHKRMAGIRLGQCVHHAPGTL